MAISKQLRDEADRTIAGISDYYEKYGDSLVDAEEREHRISKVTAALEGCNGLTEKEKIQKTAENLFGLTCTWERDSLALKRELLLNREMTEKSFEKSKQETTQEFTKLGYNMTEMNKKIDMLGNELDKLGKTIKNVAGSYPVTLSDGYHKSTHDTQPWIYRIFNIIDTHFGATAFFIITALVLLILSGNLDWFSRLVTK